MALSPMVTAADSDGDGVDDAQEVFPLENSDTTDTDADGVGNNADTDDDGDGVIDPSDAFPLNAAETDDTDGDGVGDKAECEDYAAPGARRRDA